MEKKEYELSREKLKRKERLSFAFTNFGQTMIYGLIIVYLMIYMTDYLGISAAIGGIILGTARIFDAFDEEIMLFTFPQNNYQDGTYIKKDASTQRLLDYKVIPTDFVIEQKLKFSSGWTIFIPNIKDNDYDLRPQFKGQMNIGYFEQVCGIYDKTNKQDGIAIVELLPGVYNKKFKRSFIKNANHFAEKNI